MIHILKLFFRSTLEVLRKINTVPIVCNAQRLLEGVHKICLAGVSAALLQMLSAALKKNCCGDSATELMHQFCVCARSPLCFLKVPSWEFILTWGKNRSREEIPLTFESLADFPKVSYCKE